MLVIGKKICPSILYCFYDWSNADEVKSQSSTSMVFNLYHTGHGSQREWDRVALYTHVPFSRHPQGVLPTSQKHLGSCQDRQPAPRSRTGEWGLQWQDTGQYRSQYFRYGKLKVIYLQRLGAIFYTFIGFIWLQKLKDASILQIEHQQCLFWFVFMTRAPESWTTMIHNSILYCVLNKSILLIIGDETVKSDRPKPPSKKATKARKWNISVVLLMSKPNIYSSIYVFALLSFLNLMRTLERL